MYGINFEDGGDCSLIKQFNLISGDGQPIEPMINNNRYIIITFPLRAVLPPFSSYPISGNKTLLILPLYFSPRGQDGVDEGVGGVDEKAGKLTKSGSYAEKVKNREPGELTGN